MNLNKLPRILIDVTLKTNENFILSEEDSHYLTNVLRLKLDQQILLFNGFDGEWLAIIDKITKKQVSGKILSLVRSQSVKKIKYTLAFAPIKATRMHFIIEKATELGIDYFYPIKTIYSVVDKASTIKFSKWIKAALEQSKGLIVPGIDPLNNLKDFLLAKSPYANIIFCNESEGDNHILKVLKNVDSSKLENIILIGPEGGFSPEEKDFILNIPNIYSVSLSNTILRAETAAVAAIACCKNYCDIVF